MLWRWRRQDFHQVLSMVQEQMRDLPAAQQQRATLTAKSSAADGMVEVSVDAQRSITEVVIDEKYLEDFELADLGGHIVDAAGKAFAQIDAESAALLEPLTQRRQQLTSLHGLVPDVPEFEDLMARLNPAAVEKAASPPTYGHDERNDTQFPTVRR